MQRKQTSLTQWQRYDICHRSREIIMVLIFSLNRSGKAPGYFQQRDIHLSKKEIGLPRGDGILKVHFVAF